MGTEAVPWAARRAAETEPDREPEVLVVGAGPVGLLTALLLTRRGVEVQIVDQARRPAARSYALLLHPGSLRLLDAVGLADEALERGHAVDQIAFFEGPDRRAEVDLAALGPPFACAAVLPQQALEGLLESALEREGGRVRWRHRVSDLHLGGGTAVAVVERLALEHDAVEESWMLRPGVVIGTDGHQSAVRRALRASYVEMSPPERFAVFELAADGPASREIRVVLDEQGAGALVALGGNRFRWSFQIDESQWEELLEPRFKRRVFDTVGDDPFPYLARQRLEELIARRAPWFSRHVGDIVWSMAVRFEHRLTGRFGHANAWLAGDAAHLASPIGGHSMNVGLREAAELAHQLGRILREHHPLDSLAAYEKARRSEWRQLLGARGHPAVTAAASDWVRHHAGRIPMCLPASGDDLDALLRQIGLALPAA